MSREEFFAIYAPIGWLYYAVPFFGTAMDRYADLWLAIGRMAGMGYPSVPKP
jgi:hypothetical protein